MSIRSSIKTVLTLGRGVAGGLPEAADSADPIELFGAWFETASEAGILLPESMALATVDSEGAPSVRMVLLKGFDADGFVFYTNYESRKARELDTNPRAALCFHWPVLQRQVRISGPVTRLSTEVNEAYFRSRPRASRVGAWASKQSQDLPAREELEQRVEEARRQFAEQDVPLPTFWGGYSLQPEAIEFWQGRADRLHDRLVFDRSQKGWEARRLYP